MISSGQIIGVGALALAHTILDKSDILNKVTDWITGGQVNRVTLAETIVQRAVALGSDYAIDTKMLGERSATLVPLARGVLVQNDVAQMKESVAELASEGLGTFMARDGHGVAAVGRQLVEDAVRKASVNFADKLVGDHAGEKVLATMVRQHGWQPLDTYLKDALAGVPLANFLVGRIKRLVQHAIVDKPQFDMRHNAEYRMAAGVAAEFLSDQRDFDKPLRDYAPVVMSLVQAGRTAVNLVQNGLDHLQDSLGIVSQAQVCESAYAAQLQAPLGEALVTPRTTARDLALSTILERVAAPRGPDAPIIRPVAEKLAARLDGLAPEQQKVLQTVVERLSPQQIAPLGERSDIATAFSWGNRLERIETASFALESLPQSMLTHTLSALQTASRLWDDVGGYAVGAAFARQIKTLNLDLPDNAMGYTDASVEMGKALWNTGWSMLGYDSSEPDWQDSAVLKQLYNTCGQDVEVMQEVTRYLDASLAQSAIGEPLLRELTRSKTGGYMIGQTEVRVDPDRAPKVSFQVRNEGPFVRVSIGVQYKVHAYGVNGEMRTPQSDKDSAVEAQVTVLIRASEEGSKPATRIVPLGQRVSIFNQMVFDRATGALAG